MGGRETGGPPTNLHRVRPSLEAGDKVVKEVFVEALVVEVVCCAVTRHDHHSSFAGQHLEQPLQRHCCKDVGDLEERHGN